MSQQTENSRLLEHSKNKFVYFFIFLLKKQHIKYKGRKASPMRKILKFHDLSRAQWPAEPCSLQGQVPPVQMQGERSVYINAAFVQCLSYLFSKSNLVCFHQRSPQIFSFLNAFIAPKQSSGNTNTVLRAGPGERPGTQARKCNFWYHFTLSSVRGGHRVGTQVTPFPADT